MANTKSIRLATHNVTGSRYLVQQISLGKTPAEDRVHCWGEVAEANWLSTRHEGSKSFLRSEVTVTEVEKTHTLIQALWHQNIRTLKAAGKSVSLNRTGSVATVR